MISYHLATITNVQNGINDQEQSFLSMSFEVKHENQSYPKTFLLESPVNLKIAETLMQYVKVTGDFKNSEKKLVTIAVLEGNPNTLIAVGPPFFMEDRFVLFNCDGFKEGTTLDIEASY